MNTESKRAGRVLLATAACVAIVIGAVGQASADWTHEIPGYQNTWIGSLSPVIADLDGDGGAKQIVMLTQGTPQRQAAGLVIMESDGSERAYLELEHTCGSRALASVADLDRDGSLEIVAECLQNPTRG